MARILRCGIAMFLLALLRMPAPAATPEAPAPVPPPAVTPEVVVGTLVALRPAVPAPAGTRSIASDLRVDAVETPGTTLQPGQVLGVTLPLGEDQLAPVVGDQVRVTLHPAAGACEALAPPVVVGRGELVDPGAKPTTDTGAAGAKLLVKVFAPFHTDCHVKTRDLILQFAQAHPDQVRVQVFDLRNAESRAEAERERLKCATVLVNNRYTFTIPRPGGEVQVSFQHRPNEATSSYRSEDVVTVLEQELKRLYP